jgi:hypothetical protein
LPLALALAAVSLDRLDEAERLFADAVRGQPHDGFVLLRSAQFHLRLNRSAEAEPLLRTMLGKKVQLSDEVLAWTRRQLALIVAGKEDGPAEALRLLDANAAGGDDPTADARARAFIRGTQTAERRSAIHDVEATVTPSRPLRSEERFRLARLCEASGDWEAARQHLQTLLDSSGDPDNPEYLMYLVVGLRRHNQGDEARPFVQRLKAFERGYARCRPVLAEAEK